MAYSKLYSSIVHSSLWTEQDHVRLLFITLLAIADREGFVYGSRNGLLRLANVDPTACEETDPFEVLMEPDRDSSDRLRNPENEGRRIQEMPGGFQILNYIYYRGLRNEDDRREQNRSAQQRYREKVSLSKPDSAKQGKGKPTPSASASASESASEKEKKHPKDEQAVIDYCLKIGLTEADGRYYWDKWQAGGYVNAGKAIRDWQALIRSHKSAGYVPSQKQKPGGFQKQPDPKQTKFDVEYEAHRRRMAEKKQNEQREKGN